MRSAAIVARLGISQRCADNVRNLLASQVPREAVARVLSNSARAVETQTSAFVVDSSVIEDLIVLVKTRLQSLWETWTLEPHVKCRKIQHLWAVGVQQF